MSFVGFSSPAPPSTEAMINQVTVQGVSPKGGEKGHAPPMSPGIINCRTTTAMNVSSHLNTELQTHFSSSKSCGQKAM